MVKKQQQATSGGVTHATVPLDALHPHPRNYRNHPESQIGRLAASLARFGQVRSVVVQQGADGRYLIVAGHGLAEAAKREGYATLEADVIPAHWTADAIEGYLIADNESSREAEDDLTQLAAMLEEQRNAGYHLESLGFSDDDLTALLESLTQAADADWSDVLADLPEGDKAPFQQMTFTLTDAQAAMVKRALDDAKDDAPGFDETGNANSNGNALAYIVGAFLREAVEA